MDDTPPRPIARPVRRVRNFLGSYGLTVTVVGTTTRAGRTVPGRPRVTARPRPGCGPATTLERPGRFIRFSHAAAEAEPARLASALRGGGSFRLNFNG